MTNSFASEDIDRNGSSENLTVTNPPVSEDSNKNVPSKNLIVPTENLIVIKSPASDHFEKNGSTANLIENHDKLQKKQNGSKPILKFKCQRCDHKFKRDFQLNFHNKLSNGIGIPMKCTQCNKTYCTAKGLKVHEKIHEVKKPMKCDICEYTFDSDKKMADHKKSVHAEMMQYESNLCDTSFDKEKIAIHESKSNCSNSNLNSGTQTLKENEFRAKKQKTDIICPTCNKTFLKKNSLNVHIAAVHEGSKPFVCDFCKKRFPRKADMKKHISSVHQKNKDFECTKCERKFARKHQVKDHIDLVHEKKKTYNCNICDKTFGSNPIRRRHVKLVHRERQ